MGNHVFWPTKKLFINKLHNIHAKLNIKVKIKEDLNSAVPKKVGRRNVNELLRRVSNNTHFYNSNLVMAHVDACPWRIILIGMICTE